MARKAWLQEQEAGCSHYMHSQVAESKQEVGPSFKTSRSVLKAGLLCPTSSSKDPPPKDSTTIWKIAPAKEHKNSNT